MSHYNHLSSLSPDSRQEHVTPWRLTDRGRKTVGAIALFSIIPLGVGLFVAAKDTFFKLSPKAGCELVVPEYLSGSHDTGFTEFGFATELAGTRIDPRHIEDMLGDVNPKGIDAGDFQPGQTTLRIPQEFCPETTKLYPDNIRPLPARQS